MNNAPIHRQSRSGLASRKSLSAAATALAAAMLALNASSDVRAAAGVWQANPADQGVSVAISSDGSSYTVSPTLVEGDPLYVGTTTGVGLGTDRSYYYVVGVGATPGATVRFTQGPGSTTFNASGSGSPLTVTKIPSWFTAGNWTGGVVPNAIDDSATIATDANITAIALDRDITLGALTVDTTVSSANGLNLIATTRTGGPVSTLTLKTSSGTPTLTLRGGNSFSFSESKLSGLTAANANSKLVVVGTQGLVIDNENTPAAPIAVNSGSIQVPASNVPTFGSGQVRFGFGLDWSKFSGDLTLARGVFQPLAGGSLNNNLSSLPLQSKVILGTGSNTARLEIPTNSGNNPGSTLVRGLESTSANSSIINTSTVVDTGSGIALATFEVGSYGLPTDSFDYKGNIGNSADIATVASVSAVRFVKIGPGTQILSGVNNMNATAANSVLLAVNGGKLSLGSTGAIGAITGGQGAASANSSVVMKNGEFEISGVGVVGPRSQSFGGALIFGSIVPNTNTPDANQAAQSNSSSTITVVAETAPGLEQPATLTFGSLKHRRDIDAGSNGNLNGVTMLYRGTNLGASPGPGVATIKFTTAPANTTSYASGGGSLFAVGGSSTTLGTPQAPVLKGALADTSPTGHGLGFATYDETNGVRLLSASEQTTVASGGAYDTASTADNVLFNLSGDETIAGHQSNTLQIRNVSGLSRTVTNTTTTLNATNGLLFSGTAPIVLTGGQITGTADSNSDDVLIHSLNTSTEGVTIQTPVSNVGSNSPRPGWIAYNGTGNFRLEGAQTVGNSGGIAFNSKGNTTIATTITGASILSLNQGIVKLGVAESWTNTPRLMVAPEAKFDLNGNGSTATANRFTDINAPVVASGLSFNLGGEVTNSGSTTVDLRLSTATNGATSTPYFGTITGNLNLIVDKSNFNSANSTYTYGTQSLGNVNTYTGFTEVRSGVLNIARGGRLPVTTVVKLGVTDSNANSTLSLGDSNGSTNGSVRQEIAGLEAADLGIGTGVAAVINNGSNLSQLTLNIASGENKYNGNLGVALTTNGSNSNGFGLRKIGAGIFEPAGPINTYSGGTIIQGGILRVSADSKLGQIGSITGVAGSSGAPEAPISAFANSIILDGGTLQTTTTADFVLNPKRGIGLGPVSGATGGIGSLSVDAGVKLTYAGVIASAGNTGSNTLVKNGDGVLALDGASTFTGVTQVAAGSLGGTGSLSSNVTVASGAALAPGNGGIGTFTISGALTLSGGSILSMDLGAAGTPGTSDRIQLGGTFSAGGTTTVNFTDAGGFGVGTYTLISGTAPISPSSFSVGTIPSGFQGTFSSVGNTLVVTIAVGSQQTALESWRQTNFGSSANSGNGADSADPDADGLTNLLEYATNSNPMAAGASPLTVARSGNFLTLTYTRIADTTLTYTVEGSNDLATWSTVATANNPSTGAQNVAGPVTVTDTVSLTNRRFLRLKVSY